MLPRLEITSKKKNVRTHEKVYVTRKNKKYTDIKNGGEIFTRRYFCDS